MKNSLQDIVEDIESGQTLSEACAKHPKAFDRLYCNMIKAGEAGGALEAILQRLADFKEKSQSLKRRIKSAMVYPIVVIFVACVIVGFILYFIIPKFESIFKDFNVPLPKMTIVPDRRQPLLDQVFLRGLPDAALLLDLHQAALSQQDGGLYLRPDQADDPGHGDDRREVDGGPDDADPGHPGAVGRADPRVAQHRPRHGRQRGLRAGVHPDLREHPRGRDDRPALKEARIVDDIVVNMIDVGEETGELDTMLNKIADNYDEEVETAVESLVSLLEPIMIVILGGIIGFIVIALFLPLITLISKLSG